MCRYMPDDYDSTVESRFIELSISQNPSILNQKSFSLDLFHCNFTPDISNSRFLEPIFVSLGGSRNRDSTVHVYMYASMPHAFLKTLGVTYIKFTLDYMYLVQCTILFLIIRYSILECEYAPRRVQI